MPKDILGLDEVKRIAKEYIFKIETKAYLIGDNSITLSNEILSKYVEVEIRGTEPSSRDKFESLVQGCTRRHVVVTPGRDTVIAERDFKLWISKINGEINDYLPESWEVKPESSGDRLDRELKESEIERNRFEIQQQLDEEWEREQREREKSSKFGIDIDRFKL